MHVKSVGAQSPPVGVIWLFGEKLSAQVSSSSLDRGSNLRDSLAITLVLFYNATLIHTNFSETLRHLKRIARRAFWRLTTLGVMVLDIVKKQQTYMLLKHPWLFGNTAEASDSYVLNGGGGAMRTHQRRSHLLIGYAA
ncbi:hypothetical protein TNCV_403181 [Trichonephila clavipes]|nr:hypothetical protein TNCV_403181 [Trichonephila clavipes]